MKNNPSTQKRCGFVSIVGRPNTGKSTLLNALVGEKIAIVSKIPQTTRNRIRGIANSDEGQIIFIDTPGLVRGKDRLDQRMKQISFSTVEEVDCVIHLVDANKQVQEEENMIMDQLAQIRCPLILGLNKIDAKGKCSSEYISAYEERLGPVFNDQQKFIILPLSAKTGVNIEKLIDILFDFLPEGESLYPENVVSDTPQKIVIADIIREKFLEFLRDEIPYAIAVMVEQMIPKKNKLLYLEVKILVSHESQKEIVIGKKGANLKKVGILAREELERLLHRRVFLELNVKVQKKWRDNLSILKDLGYAG